MISNKATVSIEDLDDIMLSRAGLLNDNSIEAKTKTAFYYDANYSALEKVLYSILWLLLIPVIRIILIFFITLTCMLYCMLVLVFPQNVQYKLMKLSAIFPRIFLFVLGFYYIPTKNKQFRTEAPIVVCNHTNYLDSVLMYWQYVPSFLAKQGVFSIPIIGKICKALQIIGVERESEEGRLRSRQNMQQHVNDYPKTPPLMVFPEGTTSRENTMIQFKTGAFSLRKPVQPMLLIWHKRNYDFSNVATTPPKQWMVRCFSQLIQYVTVEYLPVYHPSQEEMDNPRLYANNVRKVMFEAFQKSAKPACCSRGRMNVHLTNQSSEDFFVWKEFAEVREPQIPINSLLGFSLYRLRAQMMKITSRNESEIRKLIDMSVLLYGTKRFSIMYEECEPGGNALDKQQPSNGYMNSRIFGASFGVDCNDDNMSETKKNAMDKLFHAFVKPAVDETRTLDQINLRQFLVCLLALSDIDFSSQAADAKQSPYFLKRKQWKQDFCGAFSECAMVCNLELNAELSVVEQLNNAFNMRCKEKGHELTMDGFLYVDKRVPE